MLDPEQNRAFNDHYLEVDYDLSQVLFITTANYLPQVPSPLRDRMEVISLSGYLDQDKYAIARQFLIPKQLRANGLDPSKVTWDADAIGTIVRNYTREAGVRELERQIARVGRKLARRIAESRQATSTAAVPRSRPAGERATESALHVRTADLGELLGIAKFDPEALSLEAKVGVASGLAYTSMGGEVLEIEVSAIGGRGKLQLTGTLGDVMKESASAALSYARARAVALGIDRDFYKNRDLHVHIPAGGTPKDGPSAGIAIATAIVSALTGVPVRGDVAMTGEVTLRGRVLPIGGLKEKERRRAQKRHPARDHSRRESARARGSAGRGARRRPVSRRADDGRGPRHGAVAAAGPRRLLDRRRRTAPLMSESSGKKKDPLIVHSLEFLGGMASPVGWRPDATLPEVAFAGRSNVGKSSLINKLLRRSKAARVSNTPGRTREINFFRVNDQFVLVDLPGYGYAKVSKSKKAEWKPMIEGYLRGREKLRGIVQLLDIRHDPTDEDIQMLDFLSEVGVPTMIVMTKTDKLTKAQAATRIAAIVASLGLDEEQVIPFSAVTGLGRDDLAEAVMSLVSTPETTDPSHSLGESPEE